jgi:K+-transporting ATPase ATPase C chain
MLMDLLKHLKIGILILLLMSILTGLAYPANGSLNEQNGKIMGSRWIGQSISAPKYFWSRPSSTSPFPNNAEASGASNAAMLDANYIQRIKNRIIQIQKLDPSNHAAIPVTLVMSSGSGLDPHISPNAAYYQIPRIAKLRKIPEAALVALVSNNTYPRMFKLLGEPRINVMKLNYELDELDKNLTRS